MLAARSGRDFTAVSAPLRGAAAPRRAARRGVAGRAFASLALALLRHPARVVGTLVLGGAAGLIVVNALTFQTGRHPAPLFASAEPRAVAASVPVPAPQKRAEPIAPAMPASAAHVTAAAAVQPGTPGAVPLPPSRPAPAAAEGAFDAIGALIRSGSEPTVTGAMPEPDPRVQAAQRVLDRLGYGPLTVDGLMGPMTRAAIERFERDRGLPTTGELGPRTLREINARGGAG